MSERRWILPRVPDLPADLPQYLRDLPLPDDAATRPVVGSLTLLAVIDLYVEQGLSAADIGARAERSASLVSKAIKAGTRLAGMELRRRAGWLGGNTPPHVPAQVHALYQQHRDWTLNDIAAHLGISASTVSLALEAVGVDEAQRQARGVENTRKNLTVTDTELVRLYTEEHLTTVELGQHLSIDPSTVARRLRDLHVPLRPKGGGRHRLDSGHTHEDLSRMYLTEGLTLGAIGERVGASAARVRLLLDDAGVTTRLPRTNTPGNLDVDEAVRLYTQDNWPIYKIAQRQGVGPRRIKNALIDRKVTLRS